MRWLIVLLLALLGYDVCFAGDRVALVIGNSSYEGAMELKNPGNDADGMEQALKDLGFTVIKRKDADQRTMDGAVNDFSLALTKGGLGLFYYAGHGVQVDGENYLVPLKATLRERSDVKYQCVNAGQVLDRMAETGCGLKVLVLDCCRNNPVKRSWTRGTSSGGLAVMSNAPEGTLIAYSTAPNTEASDGDGTHSPYAEQLLTMLKLRPTEGLELGEVFRETSRAVRRATGQVPWTHENEERGRTKNGVGYL